MQDKTDMILNQMASNFGAKIGQLEGEKAILQVELQEAQQQINELQSKINEEKEGDE